MRQRGVETLMTEEPDDLIGHIRICGGAGWVTTGSTRKWTLTAFATLRGKALDASKVTAWTKLRST